ncbi:hexokinase-2, chloroplastic-like [Vigna umbellata]|uniref:hexokinase-2, chloroplastic-like n=1 Tax=Vigna umbellata TaxID=87088 RepID=UPI001F5F939F|nr:hexokinase-2, chloroplastic-like [Vigna umbellata]
MEEDDRGLIFGNGNRSVVAIDGGLYENYPQYRTYLQDSVKELLGSEKSNNVVIEHTKDGSSIGAALGGRLAGAGIVGILQKMEEDDRGLIFGNGNRSVVAIDGGLYENYPQYRTYLQDSVKELLGSEKSNNVVIEHTKDGSSIGAALLAASNSIYQQHL